MDKNFNEKREDSEEDATWATYTMTPWEPKVRDASSQLVAISALINVDS